MHDKYSHLENKFYFIMFTLLFSLYMYSLDIVLVYPNIILGLFWFVGAVWSLYHMSYHNYQIQKKDDKEEL